MFACGPGMHDVMFHGHFTLNYTVLSVRLLSPFYQESNGEF